MVALCVYLLFKQNTFLTLHRTRQSDNVHYRRYSLIIKQIKSNKRSAACDVLCLLRQGPARAVLLARKGGFPNLFVLVDLD